MYMALCHLTVAQHKHLTTNVLVNNNCPLHNQVITANNNRASLSYNLNCWMDNSPTTYIHKKMITKKA